MPDGATAASLAVGGSTAYRTKRRFVEGNLERALGGEPRPGAARGLPGREEALPVAAARSSPPEGRARWTIELPAGEMVRLTRHECPSRETARRRLAENAPQPWRREMWCAPRIGGGHAARMEDVPGLYAEPLGPKRPVGCFDESPTQPVGGLRRPPPPEPGQAERYDCECCRDGTANLFVVLDAHRPWRKVKLTERRAAADFATCMRELAEAGFPAALRIRVAMDDLSTHTPGALHGAFPAPEAHRILRRPEFHSTPERASWPDMAGIEIGVLRHRCLDRRTGERERLEHEIAAWGRERDAAGARARWMFTTEKARTGMGRAYPVAAAPGPSAEVS